MKSERKEVDSMYPDWGRGGADSGLNIRRFEVGTPPPPKKPRCREVLNQRQRLRRNVKRWDGDERLRTRLIKLTSMCTRNLT